MRTGIYQIRNKLNGKVYVGRSVNVEKRLSDHRSALRTGSHYSEHMQSAWIKYGEESFEFNVIEECDEKLLPARESHWIRELHAVDPDRGYNLKDEDGTGSWRLSEEALRNLRETMSKPEVREKIGARQRELHNDPEWKVAYLERVRSDEFRDKHRLFGEDNPFWGRSHSEETREIISQASSGERSGMWGRTHSEESREKISEKNKKFYQENPEKRIKSEETRRRMSEARKALWASKTPEERAEAARQRASGVKNREQSEETRRKKSESMKRTLAARRELCNHPAGVVYSECKEEGTNGQGKEHDEGNCG
jgi:group I intron endonuclease